MPKGSTSDRFFVSQETGLSWDRRTGEKPEEAASIEKQVEEVENKQEIVEILEEREAKVEEEIEPLQLTQESVDLLGLNEINPKAIELEQRNELALAIIQPGWRVQQAVARQHVWR